jgi:hypothetical protein
MELSYQQINKEQSLRSHHTGYVIIHRIFPDGVKNDIRESFLNAEITFTQRSQLNCHQDL